MQLFSKRYSGGLRRLRFRQYGGDDNRTFISESLRNRLLHEIQYIIQSNEYLTNFLSVNDQTTDCFYLHRESLEKLSQRELGYSLCEIFDPSTLLFAGKQHDDAKFFDLLELLIIFSKDDKREEFIERVNVIFNEEDKNFCIHGFMVIDKSETGIRSFSHLLKDEILKTKLTDFYDANRILKPNYQSLARISADILQFLFSSPKGQKANRNFSEDLCREIAKKSTSNDQINDLTFLLSETVKNAKSLNNKIENIRHTDKSSIPIDRPNFYKLIATSNMSIIELAILSLPEKYFTNKNPSELKTEYIKKYKLEKHTGWIVKKEFNYNSEIKPEDLPF